MTSTKYLCIDPGTVNLVACIFVLDENAITKMLWSKCFPVGKNCVAMASASKEMCDGCNKHGVEVALIEYQPPLAHSR